jgi:multiple sugar transport system substrate-binding protein
VTLRVALVGGPMYDGLYDLIADDVEVVVHADHPTLNRTVAAMLAAGDRIDVLATHGKYAPSQAGWLHPLDDLLDASAVGALAPRAVEMCRFQGALLCAPRNIDVRVLWYRSDLVPRPPDTWADVVASGAALGFPGRESGLFGTFFELVTSHGGRLFDDEATPTMISSEATAAIELLCELAARAPADLPSWHYDDVDRALLDGRVAMAAAWPGGYGAIHDSDIYEHLTPVPYPAGPSRRVSYAGCHAWAIPTTCADVPGAVELLHRLLSDEAATLDAEGGSVCANVNAFAAVTPRDATDDRRLEATRAMIEDGMITYPPLARFPAVEDAGWSAISAALRGETTPAVAVEQIQGAAEAALARPS